MTKKEAKEYAEQYKEAIAGKTPEEVKELLIKDKFEDKDADKVIDALFGKSEPVLAVRKFADKNTGKIYQVGDDITHLGEERHAELKLRGFVAND